MTNDTIGELIRAGEDIAAITDARTISTMYRVSRLTEVFSRHQRRSLNCSQHELEQVEVLLLLLLGGDRQYTPKQLSEAMFVSPANMTAKLSRLEQSGAVERALNPADRRSIVVRITDTGRSLALEDLKRLNGTADRMLEPLSTEEIDQLSGLLTKLLVAHGDTAAAG